MTSVIDVMSDAIGALDYATDALEAPAGSQMRETVRDLKDARRTVADLLAALEDMLNLTLDEDDIAVSSRITKARTAIAKAKGDE